MVQVHVSVRIIASYTARNPHRKADLAHIEVSRVIRAPRSAIWEALSDLASHVLWMRDALAIRFIGERRRGVGTRMEVDTRVGPLGAQDLLEVTGWEEGRSISIAHRGAIRGEGVISLADDEGGCRVTWSERLTFPWWLGGRTGALLARPVLAAVMRGNLARLEDLVSSP
jgi:hypothetical protein